MYLLAVALKKRGFFESGHALDKKSGCLKNNCHEVACALISWYIEKVMSDSCPARFIKSYEKPGKGDD
jgi:hypothetical protein